VNISKVADREVTDRVRFQARGKDFLIAITRRPIMTLICFIQYLNVISGYKLKNKTEAHRLQLATSSSDEYMEYYLHSLSTAVTGRTFTYNIQ
jgi:hypothetical protein